METGTCLLDKFIVDFSYQKVTEISRMAKQYQNNIKILFVCHGNILKSPRKASKISGFTKQKGVFYTTTTPFFAVYFISPSAGNSTGYS